MRRFWFVLPAVVLLVLQAHGPAQFGVDPNREFDVTPNLGPWMICTTSYTGPQARSMAHKLAAELRTSYKLPAYVFNFVDEERQQEQQRIRQEKERIEQVLRLHQKALMEEQKKSAGDR